MSYADERWIFSVKRLLSAGMAIALNSATNLMEVSMPNPIDQLFGIHAQALTLRSQRAELLAANLANADTPNYKAKDIDFVVALKNAQGLQATNGIGLKASQAGHITNNSNSIPAHAIRYRVPMQASLDGNTVDGDYEKSAFSENAVRYQISLSILSRRISGFIRTLRGE